MILWTLAKVLDAANRRTYHATPDGDATALCGEVTGPVKLGESCPVVPKKGVPCAVCLAQFDARFSPKFAEDKPLDEETQKQFEHDKTEAIKSLNAEVAKLSARVNETENALARELLDALASDLVGQTGDTSPERFLVGSVGRDLIDVAQGQGHIAGRRLYAAIMRWANSRPDVVGSDAWKKAGEP